MSVKLSWQDIVAGLVLMTIAALGYYFNGDHPLGTVRRMGPGYMPMLTFWILGGLGLAVFLTGLFSGPETIDSVTRRETGMAAVAIGFFVLAVILGGRLGHAGWIPHVVLLVAMIVACLKIKSSMLPILLSQYFFWIALERWGFIVAVMGSVMLAGTAERPIHVLRMLATGVGLFVLCWAIFILYLDIRVPLFPVQVW